MSLKPYGSEKDETSLISIIKKLVKLKYVGVILFTTLCMMLITGGAKFKNYPYGNELYLVKIPIIYEKPLLYIDVTSGSPVTMSIQGYTNLDDVVFDEAIGVEIQNYLQAKGADEYPELNSTVVNRGQPVEFLLEVKGKNEEIVLMAAEHWREIVYNRIEEGFSYAAEKKQLENRLELIQSYLSNQNIVHISLLQIQNTAAQERLIESYKDRYSVENLFESLDIIELELMNIDTDELLTPDELETFFYLAKSFDQLGFDLQEITIEERSEYTISQMKEVISLMKNALEMKLSMLDFSIESLKIEVERLENIIQEEELESLREYGSISYLEEQNRSLTEYMLFLESIMPVFPYQIDEPIVITPEYVSKLSFVAQDIIIGAFIGVALGIGIILFLEWKENSLEV